MKIAITGGTGFVGRHLARELLRRGHEIVLIARGVDQRDPLIRDLPGATFVAAGLDDEQKLRSVLTGCDAVAHCAGINRELGAQTYQRVHVEGTRHLTSAARQAGVKKILLVSFLRARPQCGSPYHESKWAAEQIVRASGMDYTVLKAGMMYGAGDHMLDHLSHALYTLPVFASVGLRERPIRPTAIEDAVRVICASLTEGRLTRQTVALVGPEPLQLTEAVRRIARVLGKPLLTFPLPVAFHRVMGWCVERLMRVPLISLAQVRMLAEGMTEPPPPCDPLPDDLQPQLRFTDVQIRRGLPPPGPFRCRDLRWAA